MKRPPKEVIKQLQKKNREGVKSNYTFRLPDEMMEKLGGVCKSNSITVTSVIEELVRDFLKTQ